MMVAASARTTVAEARSTLAQVCSVLETSHEELAGITVHPPATDAWEDDDNKMHDMTDEQQALLESFRTAQSDDVARQLMVVDRQATTDMRAARRSATI
jgi:RNA binding exosome subunit